MARPHKVLTGDAAERKQMHFLLEGADCIEWRKMLHELGGTEAEHARNALRAYMANKRGGTPSQVTN
jgi:hypothetical protein